MKKTYRIIVLFFVILAAGCKSAKTGEGSDKGVPQTQETSIKLKKYPGTMLWELDGFDNEGNPSVVYLLGTYHAGDDRISQFPECVQNAIDNSDRFCCELSQTDWNNLPELMNELTMNSVLTDLSHTFIDDLTQNEILLVAQFIDQDTLAQLVCFEPWVLNNYLQQVLIMACGLDTQKAYDVMIMQQLAERNITFDGLDAAKTQLDLMAWGDWDTQLVLLRDTLDDLLNLNASAAEMSELYEVFLSGDEAAFEEAYYKDLNEELEDVQKSAVYKHYIKALLADRNEAWVKKINDYIKKGGTTFIFAGCAHFVGPDSVFTYMKYDGLF